MPFGRPSLNFHPLKNLAGIASEEYQDLINCYFRKNPDGEGDDSEVIKTLGFAQSGTNASLPLAKRGLAIGAFTPSVGSAGGVYAVWDKSATDSEVYKLGAGDPTAQGISAYLPTQDTDGEFEQVNDNLYYTNGIDAVLKLTGSTSVWSQMASGAPFSTAGTVAKYLAWHNYMLFAARTVNAPNILYASDAGVPETFTGPVTKTFRHAIVGLKSLGAYLMVYTTKEIHAVTGLVPSTLGYRQLLNAHPCVSHRSIVQVTGNNGALEHWYLGADYVWATNGDSFRELGKDSWENFRSNLSTGQLAKAAASFNDITGQYELSVPTGATTANAVTWAYDPIADKWIEKPLKTAACWAKHGAPTPSQYFLDSQATGKAYLNNSGNAVQSLKTTLTGDHTISVSTLTVGSTTGFPSSGVLQVENEAISYTGVDATHFTGCTRGSQGTTAATHVGTTAVYPAMQFRYRTRHMDFSLPNMIKKFQVLWVNVKVALTAYSLSVNTNVDQTGYSLAKNIPLKTSGMVWGVDVWGLATWGTQNTLLTPTNRTAITGRGKIIKLSLDESTSIGQTEITELELRLRPLKRK